MDVVVRPVLLDDLPGLNEIRNHYILNTHVTFDVEPCTSEQCAAWYRGHSGGRRYRLIVACDSATEKVLGYTCTGRFRSKAAYDTTVEASIACRPDMVGRGIGALMYEALFRAIADEDINRIVAGIAQPNPASNAFHRRFGFQPIGTFAQVGRKFGQYWDVLWMERPLRLL